MQLLGWVVGASLVFKETAKLSPRVAVPFSIPTSNVWGIRVFPSSPIFGISLLSYFSYFDRCTYLVVPLTCISAVASGAAHLFMRLFTSLGPLRWNVYPCLLLIFWLGGLTVGIWEFFIYLDTSTLWPCGLQIFSVCRLSFHPLKRVFYLDEVQFIHFSFINHALYVKPKTLCLALDPKDAFQVFF